MLSLHVGSFESGRAFVCEKGVKFLVCQGNTLVPLQDLQYSLSHSILALSHRDFVKNSLNDSYDVRISFSLSIHCFNSGFQMFEKICTEYFRYFYEQDLARQYNLREWWHICTQKFSAKPSFHIPFTNFSISDTDEVLFASLIFIQSKFSCLPF